MKHADDALIERLRCVERLLHERALPADALAVANATDRLAELLKERDAQLQHYSEAYSEAMNRADAAEERERKLVARVRDLLFKIIDAFLSEPLE